MKKYFLLVISLSIYLCSFGQFYTFPDAGFRDFLKTKCPNCFNTQGQMDTTCPDIMTIKSLVVDRLVADITGVRFFENVDTFIIQPNNISVTQLPKSLVYLSARGAQYLPQLPATLVYIDCNGGNFYNNPFPSLPPNLEYLNLDGCSVKNIAYLPPKLNYLNVRGNYLTYLPTLPTELKYLDCSFGQITEIPPLPNGIKYLSISKNPLRSDLINLPDSLVTLFCFYDSLQTLPPFPSNLEEIDCSYNQLTVLPQLPNKVRILNVNGNLLAELPSLPNSLIEVYASQNKLLSLPQLPNKILKLYFERNSVSVLPTLPNTLKDLNCNYNLLSELPNLPSVLFDLKCNYNNISVLPTLPSGLKYLSCSNNKLQYIDAKHTSVLYMSCNDNKLDSISTPPLLGYLKCQNNKIKSLQDNPNMYTLDCSNNLISSLPNCPNLTTLDCSYNSITEIGTLDRVQRLYCNNNPLHCLPLLNSNLLWLRIKNTFITCLPNRNSFAEIDTLLLLCTNVAQICETNPYVSGKIYEDKNNNGKQDINEPIMENQIVQVLPNSWIGNSNEFGEYYLRLDSTVTNEWRCFNNSKYSVINPESYSLTPNSGGFQSDTFNFGIYYKPNIYDLEAQIFVDPPIPGFMTEAFFNVNNIGTIAQTSVQVKAKVPDGINFFNVIPYPDDIVDDTLFWNNISIGFNSAESFQYYYVTPVGTSLGKPIEFELWVNGIKGDTAPNDNYATSLRPVVGSFDPNDKQVNQESLPPNYNADSVKLMYKIRFQNTGTDTARNIVVRDTLSKKLNIKTLNVISSSHPYILVLRDENILEFIFTKIMLPDSNVNESASHGYIIFEINPMANLNTSEVIENSANIFFDFNDPVLTNKAITEFKVPSTINIGKQEELSLYPNPTTGNFILDLRDIKQAGTLNLMNINGKILKSIELNGNANQMQINVSELSNGLYVIVLRLKDKVLTSKLIKY